MNESTENLRPAQKRRAPKKKIAAARTQRESWRQILKSGEHHQTRHQVVRIIYQTGPKTCRELAEIIGCEPGSVTAATNTLEADEALFVAKEKFNARTNRWVAQYNLKKVEDE